MVVISLYYGICLSLELQNVDKTATKFWFFECFHIVCCYNALTYFIQQASIILAC